MSETVRVISTIADIDAGAWNGFASPDPATLNPFVRHEFLAALEAAGCVGGRSGWQPQHLVLEGAGGGIRGAMPAYVKSHSQGEYVFDHGWAEAYMRAGGHYYPKLQVAVPFTPAPGPRLLVGHGADAAQAEATLARAAIELARRAQLSSVHVTFLEAEAAARLADLGYLHRIDQQFHWANQGYATFDDFLGSLASRKRKGIRREREQVRQAGIEIRWITGADICEAHWDVFFAFYMDTGSRKWGRPYLNRRFFSLLGAAMAERCLLVVASRDGRPIAGALNLIGGDCLYGRYWGAVEHHPCLHFEVCYYQAIEYAIAHRVPRVEAGAQGEHKLARGYMPVATHSVHWIADPALRTPVARYLDEERRAVAEQRELLAEYAPYRKVVAPGDA